MQLVGIDGAKRGQWVLATLDAGTRQAPVFQLTQDLSEVFKRAEAGEALVVIDVPIGILSGGSAEAGRVCDREAREALGPQAASSVFTPHAVNTFGSCDAAGGLTRNRITACPWPRLSGVRNPSSYRGRGLR